MLVLKYRFTPQQLQSLTIPECGALYLDAITDQAEAENPKNSAMDATLLPSLIDKHNEKVQRIVEIMIAESKMTVEQKLELARRLYK